MANDSGQLGLRHPRAVILRVVPESLHADPATAARSRVRLRLVAGARGRARDRRDRRRACDRIGSMDCRARGLDVRRHDLAQPLPFPDITFGMVYSGQVIEHVPEPVKLTLFREALRVLRPGGQFQVRSPCRHYDLARQPGHDHLTHPERAPRAAAPSGVAGHHVARLSPAGPGDSARRRFWICGSAIALICSRRARPRSAPSTDAITAIDRRLSGRAT